MEAFDEIKRGVRRLGGGLKPPAIVEVVQVLRFCPDALNLVFRASGLLRPVEQ